MYLVSVLGKEGVGGEDLKSNVSSQLWVLMLCVFSTDYVNFTLQNLFG